MKNDKMIVVQCWDDGVTADVRLVDILRRHGAKATFNLNAGLHKKARTPGWIHRGTQVDRLGLDEMRSTYDGFVIANHGLMHPHLELLSIADARRDVVEGRERLQQFFGQEVLGFAYPFGTYNEVAMKVVREAGHVYARTIENVEQPFPPKDAMEFHSCCHFLVPEFWERYEKARRGGVFYFWGHSYEMIDEGMWTAFEDMIKRISNDPDAQWADVIDLFTGTSAR